MRGESPMRIIKSDESPIVSGEIEESPDKKIEALIAKTQSPESDIAINLKGDNAVDEWLVFVEEELGPVGGITKTLLKKKFKENLDLKTFTKLLTDTMQTTRTIYPKTLNSLDKLNKAL